MRADGSFAPMLRPEPEHAWQWGLYSASRDRWLEGLFPSRLEAERALDAMAVRARPAPAND